MDRVHAERDEFGREGYISLEQSPVFYERPIADFIFKNIFSFRFDQSVRYIYKKIEIMCCNIDARLHGRREGERIVHTTHPERHVTKQWIS